jgi:hypothetical protein
MACNEGFFCLADSVIHGTWTFKGEWFGKGDEFCEVFLGNFVNNDFLLNNDISMSFFWVFFENNKNEFLSPDRV